MKEGRGRSIAQLLGEPEGLGDPGLPGQGGMGAQPGAPGAGPQIGSRPLGWRTGAPPRTSLRVIQVIPSSAVGLIQQNIAQPATQIVGADAQSRVAILTAPFVAFTIFVSDSEGVTPRDGMPLPPGLPYEIILVGNQPLYAVTDSPVQIAPILIGDRERIY
jgi:hypothetical protein